MEKGPKNKPDMSGKGKGKLMDMAIITAIVPIELFMYEGTRDHYRLILTIAESNPNRDVVLEEFIKLPRGGRILNPLRPEILEPLVKFT